MLSQKFTYLSAICLIIVLLGAMPCQAAPRVQVDVSTYDAGKVPDGTDVIHEFQFRNVGDQVLVIKPKAC